MYEWHNSLEKRGLIHGDVNEMQNEPLLLSLKRTREKEGTDSAPLILYRKHLKSYIYGPSTNAYRSICRKQIIRWLHLSRLEGETPKEIQCQSLQF